MVEIHLLEQLLAFSQCGTLSAASEKLHLSQPALSRSMQKMEEIFGVELFDRQKNKIILNDNGMLAVEYAAKILEQEKDMIERVRAFDRSRHTIAIGLCAPAPMPEMVSLLSRLYGGMTISTEVKTDEQVICGLQDGSYQLAILHEKPDAVNYAFAECGKEQLYLSLPPAHPLSGYSGLYLKDLDGQDLLLYHQIGFWHELCLQKMPSAHFLVMTEMDVLGDLVRLSALPSFTSDVMMRRHGMITNRIAIPILDAEASVTYYCVCHLQDKRRFTPVFRSLAAE